jgi:CheY-like chemotaxis protein
MNKQTILCVDDERIVLLSLRDQMRKHFGDRYSYEFAENVKEAWEVIEELHQDGVKIIVIVSDWLMPGVKGDEFLIEIYQRFPSIVTIMLTGQADETAIERARQHANLNSYIPKPWSETTLINAIESGLEGDRV